jgi:hypothetical protein
MDTEDESMNKLRFLAGIAALFLATGTAHPAERYQVNEWILHHNFLPPAEYDKPFAGKVEEFHVNDFEDLQRFCRRESFVLGCATPWSASLCVIYLPSDDLIRKYGWPDRIVEEMAAAMRSRIAMVGGIRSLSFRRSIRGI